jgi:hypothetical protein
MPTISHAETSANEIVSARPITEVWSALGGGPLKKNRGKAFWRDGDGWNISLSNTKQTWRDFAAGAGGGVLDLIQLVRQCSRQDALRWLADYAGIPLVDRPLSPEEKRAYAEARGAEERDLREAAYFAQAAKALAEHVLDELDTAGWERAGLTDLLRAAAIERKVEQYRCPTCDKANCNDHPQRPSTFYRQPRNRLGLLALYRDWRERQPELAAAMVADGRVSEGRAQQDFAAALVASTAEVESAAA